MKKIMRNIICLILVLLVLVPAQAVFADNYTEFQTDHFTLLLPKNWEKHELNGQQLVLAPEGDAYEGVYLSIAEMKNPIEAESYDEQTLMEICATIIYMQGTVVNADPFLIGDQGDVAYLYTVLAPSGEETSSKQGDGENGIYVSGLIYAKDDNILLVNAQDYLYNDMMYTYLLAYEFVMARTWYTADGKPVNALRSYEEYCQAEPNTSVTIEANVKSVGAWSENGVEALLTDEDGEYSVFQMECTEENYKNLIPGMKLLVQGTKCEIEGKEGISAAWFDFLPCVEVKE